MQGFAALMMTAVIAACGPAARGAILPVDAEGGEAYVAELAADWTVSREVRVPCPPRSGCTVDLGLGEDDVKAVHVLFNPLRAGRVEVTSRLEDASGRASAARGETLAVDRSGFGASHYTVEASASDGRVILIAVRIPGWTASGAIPADPLSPGAPADRT